MSMLDVHADALSSKVASYHEFLSRYSKSKNVIYGFVEGRDDPCFFRGFIENQIPDNWHVELWAAGNRDQVYGIHSAIDWRRFSKKRVCFFVDRDLSDLLTEKIGSDVNIYITDGYSIENDIVTREICLRVLTEVCGLWSVDHSELDQICDVFEDELERFLLAMIPVMAWILCWRRKGEPANLNNILMRDLFSVLDGRMQLKTPPKGTGDIVTYIHARCHIAHDPSVNITVPENELRTRNLYRKFIRGKYVFWFLVEFCLSVRRNARNLFKSCIKVPHMNVTLSASNGMTLIGHRARIPASLRDFLANTVCQYIAARPLR